MGSFDIYCALCAGPFHRPSRTRRSDSDSDSEAIDPETEEGRGPDVANGSIIGRREMAWLDELRVVGKKDPQYPEFGRDEPSRFFISAVGRHADGNTVWVPATTASGETEIETYEDSVPCHRACWKLLRVATRHAGWLKGLILYSGEGEDVALAVIAEYLLGKLDPFETVNCSATFDYGVDLTRSWGQFWECVDGLEYLLSSPVESRSLQEYLSNPPRVGRSTGSAFSLYTNVSPFASGASSPSLSPIECLPLEILTQVICSLPRSSVLSFRLACRAASSVPLTQEFWKSRFFLDMPHLFEELPEDVVAGLRVDWRCLWEELNRLPLGSCADEGTLGNQRGRRACSINGWRNRKRIYTMFERIALDLWTIELDKRERTSKPGVPARWLIDSFAVWNYADAGGSQGGIEDKLYYYFGQEKYSSPETVVVYFDARVICGIEFCAGQRLLLGKTSEKYWEERTSGKLIEGWVVEFTKGSAADAQRNCITGLKILFDDNSYSEPMGDWVGNYKQLLRTSEGASSVGISAVLDEFRGFIKFGILEANIVAKTSSLFPSSTPLLQSSCWCRDLPPPSLSLHPRSGMLDPLFNPQDTSYVVFPPKDPLRKIIVYKHEPGALVQHSFGGFGFLFTSGKHVDVCDIKDSRDKLQAFEIDTERGERLVDFVALFESGGERVAGLSTLLDISFWTNYGRQSPRIGPSKKGTLHTFAAPSGEYLAGIQMDFPFLNIGIITATAKLGEISSPAPTRNLFCCREGWIWGTNDLIPLNVDEGEIFPLAKDNPRNVFIGNPKPIFASKHDRRTISASFIVFPPAARIKSITVIRSSTVVQQLNFCFSDGTMQTLKDNFPAPETSTWYSLSRARVSGSVAIAAAQNPSSGSEGVEILDFFTARENVFEEVLTCLDIRGTNCRVGFEVKSLGFTVTAADTGHITLGTGQSGMEGWENYSIQAPHGKKFAGLKAIFNWGLMMGMGGLWVNLEE